MDILIKTFNRPYYLERCLRSIRMHVQGDYQLKILDDGTPEKYLQKIALLFPEAQIIRSPLHAKKAAIIEADKVGHEGSDAFFIPSKFWIAQVQEATSLFFLLEDDIWITQKVVLPEVIELMHKEDVNMLKTYWGQNHMYMKGPKLPINQDLEFYVPKIPFVVDVLVHNHMKLQSILKRLKIFTVTNEFRISFYDLYSVASAIYRKDYWLHIWKDAANGKVNETLQLLQAAKWWKTKKGRYARYRKDVSNKSYITSATNTYPDVDLDIFRFNYILNEAWLSGKLDAMQGYPADLPVAAIESILEQANEPRATVEAWRQWVAEFRGQYEKFGYNVH